MSDSSKTKKVLTKEEVRKIAELANIHINDAELEKYGKWISDILEYVDQISDVDTSKFEFKSQTQLKNIMRKDEVKASLSQSQAVSGRASTAKDGYFTIKSVFTPSE